MGSFWARTSLSFYMYVSPVCSTCNLSWYAPAQFISNGCYSKYAAKDSSWKSLSMVYISSKERFQNNMEVTLNMLHKSCGKISQLAIICFVSKQEWPLWYSEYVCICKHGKSLGWSSSLGRKHTQEVTQKQHDCYTKWKSKGQTSLINKTIYCYIIVNIWMTFIYPRSFYKALKLVDRINVGNK